MCFYSTLQEQLDCVLREERCCESKLAHLGILLPTYLWFNHMLGCDIRMPEVGEGSVVLRPIDEQHCNIEDLMQCFATPLSMLGLNQFVNKTDMTSQDLWTIRTRTSSLRSNNTEFCGYFLKRH